MEYIMPLVQAMAELDEKSLMDAMQDALREKQKIIGQILWKNDEIGLCVSGTHAGSGAGDLTFCDEGTNLLGRHCCIIHVKKPPLI